MTVLATALAVAAGSPALAKKKAAAPCSGRYLVDDAQTPLVEGGYNPLLDAVVLDGKSVMIESGCDTVSGTRQLTKNGWKVNATWKKCGGISRARLRATLDRDCQVMKGTLSARKKARKAFVGNRSRCGDGKADLGNNEYCDAPGAKDCDEACQAVRSPQSIGQCGNGIQEGFEECDDGNADNEDACTDKCLSTSDCGGRRGVVFGSTFATIQKVIFEKRGCTQDVCHGSSQQGGLDLRPDVAYRNLVEMKATDSAFDRVEPGDQRRSYLWLKLAAATDPASLPPGVDVGTPMPNGGLPPLGRDELEAIRLWIYSGAPQTGTVNGTERLLDACLPPAEPLTIDPLEPPPPGEGIQFVMPEWPLESQSEHEVCFATYYDISDQVPKEYQSPDGKLFRFSAQQLRQDPQSHHLILYLMSSSFDPNADLAQKVHDPAYGTWTCVGGDRAGQVCEPLDKTSCGSGYCRAELKFLCKGGARNGQACNPDQADACGTGGACKVRDSFACIGYGPSVGGLINSFSIGGAQKAQANIDFVDGVFAQVPMRGILHWNSHAFNLTAKNTKMNGRLNYYFAKNQSYPVGSVFNISKIFASQADPFPAAFQEKVICNTQLLPCGARLFNISSHTHKRGKHFWVTMPDGTPAGKTIYENFVYNDPNEVQLEGDAILKFDNRDPATRTLTFCSLYNNGRNADGSPNVEEVTRRSRTPDSALGPCLPTHCTKGNVGAACVDGTKKKALGCTLPGPDRDPADASCDSTPGAGDGCCDACPIGGGESTENEMFILIGQYFVDPAAANRCAGTGTTRSVAAAPTRSLSNELALPPQLGCSASHQGHAAHANHAGH